MTQLPPTGGGRIVVGVDGSEHSRQALSWALREAARTGSTVEAIACWEWPATVGVVGPYADVDFDIPRMTRQVADEAVANVVAATEEASGVTVRTRVVEGYPARMLIEAAAGAELLVVGSRGHGTVRGLLLGSVGLHCATHAPCPVLIFRLGDPDRS